MATRGRATEYPHLARFLDGYYHQDFRVEHASPAAAARAFVAKADDGHRLDVLREFRKLREAMVGETPARWQRRLESVGGAWRPATLGAIDEVIAVLGRAE